VPSDIPAEKKREIITRWLKGDAKDRISSMTGVGTGAITRVVNDWKKELNSAITETYKTVGNEVFSKGSIPMDIVDAAKVLRTLQKQGIELAKFDSFLGDIAEVWKASGFSSEGFQDMIKQIHQLSKNEAISISQLPDYVQKLQDSRKNLEAEISEMERKKQILESTSKEIETEFSQKKVALDEFSQIKERLMQFGLSVDNVRELAEIVNNAQKLGYDSSMIIRILSNIESAEKEKDVLDLENKKRLELQEQLRAKLLSIEQMIEANKETIDLLEKLDKLGFGEEDFKELSSLIEAIAANESIENSAAKNNLIEYFKVYNNDKQQIQQEIDNLNAELDRKQLELGALESTYLQNKNIADIIERLQSRGFNETILAKLGVIVDLHGIELDSLTQDLQTYGSLRRSIRELTRSKVVLEEEERLLRHKLVATEDQRQRLLTIINETLRSSASKSTNSTSTTIVYDKEVGDLKHLIRASKGEDVSLDELKVSTEKAIDIVCEKLASRSITKAFLQHAKRALEYEVEQETH